MSSIIARTAIFIFVEALLIIKATGQNEEINKSSFLQPGVYQSVNSEHFYNATIALNEDGYFQYKGRWDLFPFNSSGKWKIKGGYLHLMSSLKNFDNLDISVTEHMNSNSSEIVISVQNDINQDLKCLILFNQDSTLECTWEGCYFEPRDDLRSLQVFYEKGTSKPYFIKNPNSNIFYITLPGVPFDLNGYEPIFDSLKVIDSQSFLFKEHIFKKRE